MYADDIDFASELAQRERDYAATVRKPELTRTGKCKACEAPLEASQALFCDKDCERDYLRIRRSQAIAGKATD